MKTINNFFLKGSLLVIGLFSMGITLLITSILVWMIADAGLTLNLKIGSFLGLLVGFFVVSMTYLARESMKFWAFSDTVEKMVDDTTTAEQIDSIFNNEFQTLRKLSGGGPHTVKLTEIFTIMKTKKYYILYPPVSTKIGL